MQPDTKKSVRVVLMILAVLLYLAGIWALAEEVRFSMTGLWFTLTNGMLLGSFIATGLGALAPGAIAHYFAHRLRQSAKAKPTAM